MELGANQRILVIDDEESLRQMLALLLSREGLLVESAANGEEGLSLAEKRE